MNRSVQTTYSVEDQYWLKPEQVDDIRLAVYDDSQPYLQARDRLLIRTLYTWGLRVSEAVALDVNHLDLDDNALRIPFSIQKDYPSKRSPPQKTFDLTTESVAEVRDYLWDRWKDTDALFPARSPPRMSERAVQNVVKKLPEETEVRPHSIDGRGEPADVTPHVFWHSMAYRMVGREGKSLDAVQRRLCHGRS